MIKVELDAGDVLDLTEALNMRISYSKDVLDKAELAGKFDGRPVQFRAGFEARIARLEALRTRIVNQWSGR